MIRRASPSTIAVLPTPGSPISTGLFFVRRESTCITRRISLSRPMTGSILPAPRQFGQVAPVFLQRLIFSFRILIRHALRTAHLLQRLHQLVARHSASFNNFAARTFSIRQREQIMFGAEEFILQLRHFFFRGVDRRCAVRCRPLIDSPALDLRSALQFLSQSLRADPDIARPFFPATAASLRRV